MQPLSAFMTPFELPLTFRRAVGLECDMRFAFQLKQLTVSWTSRSVADVRSTTLRKVQDNVNPACVRRKKQLYPCACQTWICKFNVGRLIRFSLATRFAFNVSHFGRACSSSCPSMTRYTPSESQQERGHMSRGGRRRKQ